MSRSQEPGHESKQNRAFLKRRAAAQHPGSLVGALHGSLQKHAYLELLSGIGINPGVIQYDIGYHVVLSGVPGDLDLQLIYVDRVGIWDRHAI